MIDKIAALRKIAEDYQRLAGTSANDAVNLQRDSSWSPIPDNVTVDSQGKISVQPEKPIRTRSELIAANANRQLSPEAERQKQYYQAQMYGLKPRPRTQGGQPQYATQQQPKYHGTAQQPQLPQENQVGHYGRPSSLNRIGLALRAARQ
jgi:hypothetical protein